MAGILLGLILCGAAFVAIRHQALRLPIIGVIVVVLLGVVLAVVATMTNDNGQFPSGSWSSAGFWTVSFVATGTEYTAASCPTTGTCLAEGLTFGPQPVLSATSNGGESWVNRTAQDASVFGDWLSCWDDVH